MREGLVAALLRCLDRKSSFADRLGPLRLYFLASPTEGQRIGRNILGDDTAGGYIYAPSTACIRGRRGLEARLGCFEATGICLVKALRQSDQTAETERKSRRNML